MGSSLELGKALRKGFLTERYEVRDSSVDRLGSEFSCSFCEGSEMGRSMVHFCYVAGAQTVEEELGRTLSEVEPHLE